MCGDGSEKSRPNTRWLVVPLSTSAVHNNKQTKIISIVTSGHALPREYSWLYSYKSHKNYLKDSSILIVCDSSYEERKLQIVEFVDRLELEDKTWFTNLSCLEIWRGNWRKKGQCEWRKEVCPKDLVSDTINTNQISQSRQLELLIAPLC